jgi:hypothetical protein
VLKGAALKFLIYGTEEKFTPTVYQDKRLRSLPAATVTIFHYAPYILRILEMAT